MKLIKGAGSLGRREGCWMSAVSVYTEEGWSDHPQCVDPLIRTLCIKLNDGLSSDAVRERVIFPHLFAPVGTADKSLVDQRRSLVVVATVRWAALAKEQADAAYANAAANAFARAAFARAANAAANDFARAVAFARAYTNANAVANTNAVDNAAYAAVAYAARAYTADTFWETEVLPVILELCALSHPEGFEVDAARVENVERALSGVTS